MSKLIARRVSSAYATITLDQLTEFFSARENYPNGDAMRWDPERLLTDLDREYLRVCLYQPVFAIPFSPLREFFWQQFFSPAQ